MSSKNTFVTTSLLGFSRLSTVFASSKSSSTVSFISLVESVLGPVWSLRLNSWTEFTDPRSCPRACSYLFKSTTTSR
ncbi:hypothetical protein [Mesomycoplasma ovipneumoniae]|uniref:hypothetical protein n=1 Tax=Mesomycoplasma ovipneumoniae TaxID=29562 RepID=UPI00311C8C3A